MTPELRSGTWFRLRIQLLPDGRCAFALNGRPIGIGATPVDRSLHYRVMLHGSSHRTRVLAGPVRVWSGVPGDIDWAALEDTVHRTARLATGGGIR